MTRARRAGRGGETAFQAEGGRGGMRRRRFALTALSLAIRIEGIYHFAIAVAFLHRIHNPHGYSCGCDEDCWCRRTAFGRLAKWWIKPRYVRFLGFPHVNRSLEEWKRTHGEDSLREWKRRQSET